MKPIIITLCVSSLFTNLSMHTIADKQERISDKTESVIKTIENLEETELWGSYTAVVNVSWISQCLWING